MVLCSIIRSSTVCSNASLLSTTWKADYIAIRNITSTAPINNPCNPSSIAGLLSFCTLRIHCVLYLCEHDPDDRAIHILYDTALKACSRIDILVTCHILRIFVAVI